MLTMTGHFIKHQKKDAVYVLRA